MFEFDIEKPWNYHLHHVSMEIDLSDLIDGYDYPHSPSSVTIRLNENELRLLIAKLQQQLSILKELNKDCKVPAYDYAHYPDHLLAAARYRDRFYGVSEGLFFDLTDDAEQNMRTAIAQLDAWERLNTDKED